MQKMSAGLSFGAMSGQRNPNPTLDIFSIIGSLEGCKVAGTKHSQVTSHRESPKHSLKVTFGLIRPKEKFLDVTLALVNGEVLLCIGKTMICDL